MHDDEHASIHARWMPAMGGSTLLAFLQSRGSPFRRRALIVLLVSVSLWIYATTWDILVMLFDSALDEKGVGVADIVQRVLIRLLLFPLLVGAYLLAVNIALQRHKTGRFVAKQIVIAMAFSALTRPALIISYYAVNRVFGTPVVFAKLIHEFMPWQYWAATTIQYSIVYLLGLVLIFGINAFLRFKSEQLKATQLRSKWLEARLGTLRGQLNPHFFFNSLNTIVALIHTDPDRAEKLLTELSALIRRSLTDSHHEFTTVREEMHFVERYLAVMKARYEDRLDVNIALDQQTINHSIPTFLLVPFVENAIKHGVAKIPGKDTVEIRGRYTDEFIMFTVKNAAGKGANGGEKRGSGMGLKNTRRRLFAIYGNRYHLECGPDDQGRWVANVAIPMHHG
ncbi:MAG: histidine kinase [Gammaproteobacteria bacterium]|nr:histidine kinase [Gammaproteobacteria bacterium]